MKYRNIVALAIGFGLDALLGDPRDWPHVIKLVGKQIAFEEKLLRTYLLVPETGAAADSAAVAGGAAADREALSDNAASPSAETAGAAAPDAPEPLEAMEGWPLDHVQTERLAGVALAADVALLAPAASWVVLKACERIHPLLALAVESALCYQLIAARSLCDESMAVHDALATGDVEAGRKAVGMIVGRDTDQLDEQGIVRAAVETVAENASDGVIAPMLFMGMGGAPAAMVYKAVNTLDSMVGYKNERYLNLGWASARLDDLLNIMPSRVAGALMCAAAGLANLDPRRAWQIFLRDRDNHTSPNAAQTEAACAGALGVQLGGGNFYFGEFVEKPTIGDATRPLEVEDIARANKLMYATAVLGVAASAVVGLLTRASKAGGAL